MLPLLVLIISATSDCYQCSATRCRTMLLHARGRVWWNVVECGARTHTSTSQREVTEVYVAHSRRADNAHLRHTRHSQRA
jgi:hypothetical protein